MREDELVSIIVPIYNVEKYLRRCIDSLKEQTYKKLEIILVNDGSPDNCLAICNEYKELDDRIIVIDKKNGGLSDARNFGLNRAKGEYIAFVDSDDYVENDYIESLLKSIKKNNTKIAQCAISIVDEEENYIKSWKNNGYSEIEDGNKLFKDYMNHTEYSEGTIVVWNKIYHKSLLQKIRFPVGKINEDEFFTYKIFYNEKVSIVKDCLYNYVQNPNGIMSNLNKKIKLDVLEAHKERTLFYLNNDENELYDDSLNSAMDFILYIYKRVKNSKNKEQYNMIKKYYKEYYKMSKNVTKKLKNIIFYISPKLYLRISTIMHWGIFRRSWYRNVIFDVKYNIFSILNSNKETYLLLDTPNHGNLGDHAIALAEKKFFDDRKLEYFIVSGKYMPNFYKKNLCKKKIRHNIIYTGGGFLGSVWENEQMLFNSFMEKLYENNIVLFPQTFYYSNDNYGRKCFSRDKKIIDKCKNIKIYCRDFASYELVKNKFEIDKTYYVPDMVLYMDDYKDKEERNGIGLCLRNDREKILNEENIEKLTSIIKNKFKNEQIIKLDTVIPQSFSTNEGFENVEKLLKNSFGNRKLIITDRLHGMIFSAITNTPCIALANSTGKVKGVYDWIRKDNNYIYFADSIDEIEKILTEVDITKKNKYNSSKIKEEINKIEI